MPRLPGAITKIANRAPVTRDRIWQSIRIMRRFTGSDLAATAEASTSNVRKYLRGLTRAGIIRIVRERRSGIYGGHTVYQLTSDLGPQAPRLCSSGNTYNPNSQQTSPGGIKQ